MDSDERFAVLSENVQLAHRSETLPAFFAAPQTLREEAPAVVLAMHLWGVDASMRAAAERFARAGFVTLVPDLYARLGAPAGDDASDPAPFVPFARRLTTVDIDAAFGACVSWLHGRYPLAKIGLAGFCMGGRMATARASGHTTFAAVAAWYGLADIDPQVVDVPLVGSYGGDDTGIPVERVRAFEAGLEVPHDIVIYPGAGHAFADERRDSFELRASEDSWRRTLHFFETHLRKT